MRKAGMTAVCVTVSGSFLSSLLFKLKNVPGDAEGFLLGKICTHQVEKITDSQSRGCREEKKLCPHSFRILIKRRSFYDRMGSLDEAKIEEILGDQFHEVIGWFSYRRNSSHRLSMMERALHRRLIHYFTHLQNQDVLLALITEQVLDMSSVHSTEYSFQCWDGGKFQVVNSAMLTLSSGNHYQMFPTHLLPSRLTYYNAALKGQRAQFTNSEEEIIQSRKVEELCATMLQTLKPLQEELLATSKQLHNTINEVEQLREAVAAAQEESECEGEEALEASTEEGNPTVNTVPSEVSTGLLIDLESTSPVPCDQSETLPTLSSTANISTPIGLEADSPPPTHQNSSHKPNDLPLNCVSQELF